MITFKLKFLLAFALKEKSKKDKVPGGKGKNVTESKDPSDMIRLEKYFSAAHIEYELVPGKCKYQIDVLCWSNAAKIYTADGVKIFTTVFQDGLTFVPVCIMHQLKDMSIEDLVNLQSTVIEFNLYTDKAKLGNAAKANKTEVVYLREFDCAGTEFVEAFTESFDMSVSLMSTKKSQKTLKIVDNENMSQHGGIPKNDTVSQMNYEDDFGEKLYEIMEFIRTEEFSSEELQFKDFVRAYKPNDDQGKKSAKTDAADSKKPKVEKSLTKLTLQVQGEIFFTDPSLAMFKIEHPKCEVAKFFVILHVDDLLTRLQKIHLNPIVIKIKHISHLPIEPFKDTGFTDMYCKYSIPCIAECKTIEKPIGRSVYFNESHIYFTHTLSKIKLLEFLEARRLIIEVYGVKKNTQEKDPKLFGEKASDSDISKIHFNFQDTCSKQEEKSKGPDELLAYCSYDLSSLLRNIWDFRDKAQLHNLERSKYLKHTEMLKTTETNDTDMNCDFWNTYKLSTNSVNLAYIFKSFERGSTGLLKEWMLLENDTTLSLEAYLLSPQAAALVVHQIANTYKRLFLIALDNKTATEVFAKVLKHNQTIICKKLNADNLLTGWALDNGNNFAIYVEGLAVGYILNIWQELDSYSVDEIKVFFNTDQAYEKRLYPICSKWSGLFMVSLKVPLEYILKDERLYVKGNAPILCLKALSKLHILFHTRNLKQMLQFELFPTLEELECIDIEYGVPYAWKPYEVSESVSITDSEIIQMEPLE